LSAKGGIPGAIHAGGYSEDGVPLPPFTIEVGVNAVKQHPVGDTLGIPVYLRPAVAHFVDYSNGLAYPEDILLQSQLRERGVVGMCLKAVKYINHPMEMRAHTEAAIALRDEYGIDILSRLPWYRAYESLRNVLLIVGNRLAKLDGQPVQQMFTGESPSMPPFPKAWRREATKK
jgi:hypothetical protein